LSPLPKSRFIFSPIVVVTFGDLAISFVTSICTSSCGSGGSDSNRSFSACMSRGIRFGCRSNICCISCMRQRCRLSLQLDPFPVRGVCPAMIIRMPSLHVCRFCIAIEYLHANIICSSESFSMHIGHRPLLFTPMSCIRLPWTTQSNISLTLRARCLMLR
jgi:hypothetical protein